MFFDNSHNDPILVAKGGGTLAYQIYNAELWKKIKAIP